MQSPPPPYNQAVSMGHTTLMSNLSDAKQWGKSRPVVNTGMNYTPPSSPSDVPTAVSTLLGLTKQLQEMLRHWSMGQASESQVSDAYILVGMQFNATVNAFARYHVDMSDLFYIPTELRNTLELCLGEDPCQRTLDRYMPAVRAILYALLQGLQSKQIPYRKAVDSSRPHSSGSSTYARSPVDDHNLREFRRSG
ncbi:hypothetical protein EIP91_008753 [Steccherinum ochraceum]|uniref:Aip3p/Bud6 N-terminal domain-containing protein n=1 Tax=Steccherinum ochraceum TaxID=92696 RepID=A0A4R0RKT0_9APHY|nr:hypothetical protein EIP91_008753 [Steccherinum ochraceum]